MPPFLLTLFTSRATWIGLAIAAILAFGGCQQMRIHRLQGKVTEAQAQAAQLQTTLDAAADTNKRMAAQIEAQSAAVARMQADAEALAKRAADAATASWARSTARRKAAAASTERTPEEMTRWLISSLPSG